MGLSAGVTLSLGVSMETHSQPPELKSSRGNQWNGDGASRNRRDD